MEAFAWRWIFSLLSCHDFKFCQRDTQTHNLQLSRSESFVKFHVEIQSYSNCRFDPNCPKLHPDTLEQLSETQGMWAPGHFNLSGLAKQTPNDAGANANIAEVPRRSVRSVLCGSVRCVSRSSCEIKWGEAMNGVSWEFGIWKTPLHLWWPTQTRQSHEYIWPRSKTSTNSHPHTRTYTHIHL